MGVEQALIDQIHEIATGAFKDHVIQEQSRNGVYRSWRCGRVGTSVYHFVITTIPGSLIITGDLGSMIVTRAYDMLPWCRRSIDSIEYFAEKVDSGFKKREFSRDKFLEWLDEEEKEFRESHADDDDEDESESETLDLIDALRHLSDEYDASQAYQESMDLWEGNDPPNLEVYTSRFLWLREAIAWFVNNHDEPALGRDDG